MYHVMRAQKRPAAFSANGGNGSRLSLRAEVAAKVRTPEAAEGEAGAAEEPACDQVEAAEAQSRRSKRAHTAAVDIVQFSSGFCHSLVCRNNWRNWGTIRRTPGTRLRARRGSEALYALQ